MNLKPFFNLRFGKFILAGGAFAVWIIFFDENDLVTQYNLRQEVTETEKKIEYLNQEIEKSEHARLELISSPDKLEKFARENYLMKRDDEDLFVFKHVEPTAPPAEETEK
jgi:cell division protein FtsB